MKKYIKNYLRIASVAAAWSRSWSSSISALSSVSTFISPNNWYRYLFQIEKCVFLLTDILTRWLINWPGYIFIGKIWIVLTNDILTANNQKSFLSELYQFNQVNWLTSDLISGNYSTHHSAVVLSSFSFLLALHSWFRLMIPTTILFLFSLPDYSTTSSSPFKNCLPFISLSAARALSWSSKSINA